MASPKLIVEAITRRCDETEPRFDGYREELLTRIVEILSREREHRVSPTNVQQKVQDQVEALGDLVWQRSKAKA